MPNALAGKKKLYECPELRAQDLMDAFKDDSIKAIITLTGGDDTIRLLPYIDFDVIKNNPKIFIGFSDTTANHFMMYKAGLVSYYGPAAAVEFSKKKIFKENVDTVINTLFDPKSNLELTNYDYIVNDPQDEEFENFEIFPCDKGYEVVQGQGIVEGKLIGGCIELFQMINGTSIWPELEEWKDKVLFVETSEDKPSVDSIKYTFYNLGAQGILENINGILIGRPKDGEYYEEYNTIIKEVTRLYGREDLPIISNCHFGHAWLWHILPMGETIKIDCENKKLILVNEPTKK
jgi:muramoyltetrapeptide carboxypeptidase LdcA involved in peptidoglycan recycling